VTVTRDPILRGRLTLWQPEAGYRFSVDSLLLADFVAPLAFASAPATVAPAAAPLGRVCELCAGCGVIGLALLLRDAAATATLVELQPRLAELARRNADENGLGARVEVRCGDLSQSGLPGAAFELAVANPPYQPIGSGPPAPDAEEAIARHELRTTLDAVVRELKRLLVPGGRAALVHPAERLPALLSTLDGHGLRPLRLRLVHPRANEPATRALVEAKKGAKSPLVIEPPLVLLDSDGSYTPDAKRALGEL
jgi:tRNA1(Val) A37 N6-methylase TrmN6